MSSSNIISLQSVTYFKVTFKDPLDSLLVDRLFHIFHISAYEWLTLKYGGLKMQSLNLDMRLLLSV